MDMILFTIGTLALVTTVVSVGGDASLRTIVRLDMVMAVIIALTFVMILSVAVV